MAIGGVLVVSAAARILMMQWIQTALETEDLTVRRAGTENEAAEDTEIEDAKAKGLAVGNPTNTCPQEENPVSVSPRSDDPTQKGIL